MLLIPGLESSLLSCQCMSRYPFMGLDTEIIVHQIGVKLHT